MGESQGSKIFQEKINSVWTNWKIFIFLFSTGYFLESLEITFLAQNSIGKFCESKTYEAILVHIKLEL